jgi:Domain of unknown function (DUF5063)
MSSSQNADVNNFAEIARGFCSWCESSTLEGEADAQAASWLCKLYAAALTLPDVNSESSDDLPDIPLLLLERTKKNLASFNGRYYRECFNPDPSLSDEPVIGDIGDDLLDIYKDIRPGLVLYDSGETTEAIWYWRFLHNVHWGRHAAGAIFALHCLSIGVKE